ncbi:MAG: hypothetical protein U1C66_00385 [Patescibacteria group bacterium]|nr:hypothetical protein [bacterium]MDZ4225934.1 hypothetical protein [Patescibacteria group bacterium]
MKKYINIFPIALFFLPGVAFAELTGVKDLIQAVGGLLNPLIAIVVAVALLVFFWGLAKFIFRLGGDEKAVEEGKRIMLWGLLALFVMVSVWGIINFMQKELNLPSTTSLSP